MSELVQILNLYLGGPLPWPKAWLRDRKKLSSMCPITHKNLLKPILSALLIAKTDNFRFEPEKRRRFENLRSSFDRAGPIALRNCQKPNVAGLYIEKTGNFRITGHDRSWPEIFVPHLKEHHLKPINVSFHWFSSTGFRETDNFRITGHGRF